MEKLDNDTMVTLNRALDKKLEKALLYSRYKERGLSSNPFNIDFSGNVWKVKVGRDDELISGVENLKEMADGKNKMLNISNLSCLCKSFSGVV